MNNLTYEDFFFLPENKEEPLFLLTLYNNTTQQNFNLSDIQKLKELISSSDYNLWLEIQGATDKKTIEEIGNLFNLDYLTQQDILNLEHPTKIETRENYVLLISKIFAFHNHNTLHQEQLTIICGEHFVICFEEKKNDFFEVIRQAFSNNTLNIKSQSSEYLFYFLLKIITKSHSSVLEYFNEKLEQHEEKLLSFKNIKSSNSTLQNFKHQYSTFKKNIPILLQETQQINNRTLNKSLRPFFNDLQDHLKLANQNLESTKEALDSLVELYISNMNIHLNEIIKRLTIISTIFIPLTFMAGIWGTNFKYMPELESPYGYPIALSVMATTGLLIYLYFKKREW